MGIVNGSWNSQQVTINEELGAGEAAGTPQWHPPNLASPRTGRQRGPGKGFAGDAAGRAALGWQTPLPGEKRCRISGATL